MHILSISEGGVTSACGPCAGMKQHRQGRGISRKMKESRVNNNQNSSERTQEFIDGRGSPLVSGKKLTGCFDKKDKDAKRHSRHQQHKKEVRIGYFFHQGSLPDLYRKNKHKLGQAKKQRVFLACSNRKMRR